MHCVRDQSGTSAKEGIGEVGAQHLAVFSADLASGQLQFWVNVVNFWQCMSAKGLQHEKCGNIRPFFYVLMDILSRISSVRDVSWVCYAYMWFYDLRKVEHWIFLCSLVQRPNQDQGVNHPELRQMTLLVRWVWIYLCFEIDQWLEVLWCSMEHHFQCFSKHLAATVEMSSIQYGWFY